MIRYKKIAFFWSFVFLLQNSVFTSLLLFMMHVILSCCFCFCLVLTFDLNRTVVVADSKTWKIIMFFTLIGNFFVMFLYFHTNKMRSSINYIKNRKNKSSKIENYSYSMCYFYRDILGSTFTQTDVTVEVTCGRMNNCFNFTDQVLV